MNWTSFEKSLFRDAVQAIDDISPTISEETVLAFCFDCQSEDGMLIANINTKEGLSRRVKQYLESYDSYANKPEKEIIASLSQSVGDFSHFNIAPDLFRNCGGIWDHFDTIKSNEDFDSMLEELEHESDLFMSATARVIIRLHDDDSFSSFNLSNEFIAFCNDHDESVQQGVARIELARSLSRTKPA